MRSCPHPHVTLEPLQQSRQTHWQRWSLRAEIRPFHKNYSKLIQWLASKSFNESTNWPVTDNSRLQLHEFFISWNETACRWTGKCEITTFGPRAWYKIRSRTSRWIFLSACTFPSFDSSGSNQLPRQSTGPDTRRWEESVRPVSGRQCIRLPEPDPTSRPPSAPDSSMGWSVRTLPPAPCVSPRRFVHLFQHFFFCQINEKWLVSSYFTGRNVLSVDFVGPSGVVTKAIDSTDHVKSSFRQRFAIIQRLQTSQIVGISFNEIGQLRVKSLDLQRRTVG